MIKTTEILQECAKLEAEHAKVQRIKTFLNYTHKIIEALILYEKINTLLVTTLNDLQLSIFTVAVFLKKIQNTVPQPGEPNFYQDYLKMEYEKVKKVLLDNFITRELTEYENRAWTDSEKTFIEKIISKLEETILPITVHLQSHLDKEEKQKKADAQVTARFKRTSILNATEATAIAVNDTSTNNNLNMEQHIKKLVYEAVKAQVNKNNKTKQQPQQQQQQQNSRGGKRSRSSPPPKENGNIAQQPQSKKQKTSNNNKEPEPCLKKTDRFQTNPTNQSSQKNKKNKRGHQEGKKKEVRKGKRKR